MATEFLKEFILLLMQFALSLTAYNHKDCIAFKNLFSKKKSFQ